MRGRRVSAGCLVVARIAVLGNLDVIENDAVPVC
jgi:hypothetical protein